METEVVKGLSTALTSLTTTGMVIVALTVIIFALAKFGVLTKFLDKELKKRYVQTPGMLSRETIEKFQSDLQTSLQNDEDFKGRLDTIERQLKQMDPLEMARIQERLESITENMRLIQESQFEYRMEAYKKTIFDTGIPLIDRMAAGIKFLLAGGNAETKKFLTHALAHEDLYTWNGLCKALQATEYWQRERDGKPRSPEGVCHA